MEGGAASDRGLRAYERPGAWFWLALALGEVKGSELAVPKQLIEGQVLQYGPGRQIGVRWVITKVAI